MNEEDREREGGGLCHKEHHECEGILGVRQGSGLERPQGQAETVEMEATAVGRAGGRDPPFPSPQACSWTPPQEMPKLNSLLWVNT